MNDQNITWVEVVLAVPLRRSFTYRVTSPLTQTIAPGAVVVVPFGKRRVLGFVTSLVEAPQAEIKTKDVLAMLGSDVVFDQELLGFLKAAADYYLHPLGEVLATAAPPWPTKLTNKLKQGELDTLIDIDALIYESARRWVLDSSVDERAKLGARQKAIIDYVVEHGVLSEEGLQAMPGAARASVRALVEKGVLREERVLNAAASHPLDRDQLATITPPTTLVTLSEPQDNALRAINASIASNAAQAFLMHGVTGSGKTEVFLRAASQALAKGLGVIILVPEIALTPQLIALFKARLAHPFCVLHSAQKPKERIRAWNDLRQRRVRLALGARSALFAPVQHLSLIVVDEEHDGSFKQEEGFRYHARDMALLRAQRGKATAVLCSATPALETYTLAKKKRVQLLELPARVTDHSLPDVELVDLRRNKSGPSGHHWLSTALHRALEQCLNEGHQAILFLNRRGFNPSLRCTACGELLQCPACSVALTEHRSRGLMACHYCDYTQAIPKRCAKCDATSLEGLGLGTEQVQNELTKLFAQVRVARLDRDTAGADGGRAVMEAFRQGEADILVGTQMVSKGHDIRKVTVVGVLSADHALSLPDFRASERTFQLLSQVAGRAGRGDKAGRVFVQTYQPELALMQSVRAHDYKGFYAAEMQVRQTLEYPPFSRMVAVRVDAADEHRARDLASELAKVARHAIAHVNQGAAAPVRLLGPAEAPIARVRGRYRQRFLLIGAERALLRRVADVVLKRIEQGVQPARASVDIDPYSML